MSLPTDEALLALQDAAYRAAMRASPRLDYEAEAEASTIVGIRAVRDAILDALIADAEAVARKNHVSKGKLMEASMVADWLRAEREDGP